jgi:hypothetical protein
MQTSSSTSSGILYTDAAPLDQPLTRIPPTALLQGRPTRAALPGLTLALLTVLGFALGGLFGLNEDVIKDRLAASAAAVTATVYKGDPAAPSR